MLSTEIIESLDEVAGQHIFLTCEPENPDFTDPRRPSKLVVMAKGLRFDIPLPENRKECIEFISGINASLYQKRIITLSWKIKGFLSYVRARTHGNWQINGSLVDLHILEAFSGEQGECPKNFKDAYSRLSRITQSVTWQRVGKVYQEVYLPLLTRVIPKMESLGLNDVISRRPVYPCYELEGQVNGRMKCLKAFAHAFNPHGLDEVAKANLRPIGYDKVFMLFDYKHMEVAVLQWLSGDKTLKEILNSGEDVYKNIWERITNIPCTEAGRSHCKSVFLPVVYGQSGSSVAKKLGIKDEAGKMLVANINRFFPKAMSWIQEQQETFDANSFATDYFGRRRRFEEQQYKIRNFVVQAPASIICLHKLVRLHDVIQENSEIVFHIHDGYGIVTHKSNTKVADIVIKTLEAKESFYPGLRLRVSGSQGESLSSLKPI